MHRKIILTYKNEEGNLEEESLWGEKTGKGQYKIANIAFFAPNIAWEDIVQVEEENGNLYFDKLLEASGNSTLQIIFFTHDYGDILKELEKMGCQWEGLTNKTYISLNIPREYIKTKCYRDINLLLYFHKTGAQWRIQIGGI